MEIKSKKVVVHWMDSYSSTQIIEKSFCIAEDSTYCTESLEKCLFSFKTSFDCLVVVRYFPEKDKFRNENQDVFIQNIVVI